MTTVNAAKKEIRHQIRKEEQYQAMKYQDKSNEICSKAKMLKKEVKNLSSDEKIKFNKDYNECKKSLEKVIAKYSKNIKKGMNTGGVAQVDIDMKNRAVQALDKINFAFSPPPPRSR